MNYIDAKDAEDFRDGAIKIHTHDDFNGMRKAGRLAAECLDMLVPLTRPGISTETIDKAAREYIQEHFFNLGEAAQTIADRIHTLSR